MKLRTRRILILTFTGFSSILSFALEGGGTGLPPSPDPVPPPPPGLSIEIDIFLAIILAIAFGSIALYHKKKTV